jgi:undecaprenyl-diphosphatase
MLLVVVTDLLKAAFLGVVQGLTEFLPVSSTGHLILFEEWLGVDEDRYGLTFDVALHAGTLAALLWFFWRVWLGIAAGALRSFRTRAAGGPETRLFWLLVIGTVPAAVAGFALEDTIERWLRSPLLVASTLIAFSAVFFAAEALGARVRQVAGLRWPDAVVVGLAQALALVPGVSRSGATISAGLFLGMERSAAATFGFLLSAPVIAGASLKQSFELIGDWRDGRLTGDDLAFFAVGFVCALAVGYLSIGFLLRYLRANSLHAFAYYRIALGLVAYGVAAAQALA